MAISWNYNANDYQEVEFQVIPVGDHRVRISKAEEMTSSNGNDMIKLTLDVSGHNGSLWYYLVFMPDNPQITNQKLGQIFNSFGIASNNMNISDWVGKAGACRVAHELYKGENTARVKYFLTKEKQETLPAWQEPSNKASVTGGGKAADITADDDLPF